MSMEQETVSLNVLKYACISKGRVQPVQEGTELDERLQAVIQIILQEWPDDKEQVSSKPLPTGR